MPERDYSDIGRPALDDEGAVKLLIEQYQQRAFALVLYLIGDDRDKAYEITASSFVEAFRSASSFEDKSSFLIRLIRMAIEKSRNAEIIPFSDETDFEDFSPERRNSLLVVKKALGALTFNEKALLLLRDQLRLSYGEIGAIFRVPEGEARTQVVRARVQIRKKVEEVLK
ncbi:MAG: sigma factor-like helix-turn-helix DNA-binding protein [Candidatus Omnitrophota bacterium]